MRGELRAALADGAEVFVYPDEADEQRFVAAYPLLRRFAFVVADSDCDPDDLLHEALVRVLSRGSLEGIDDLVAYARRVVVNVAVNNRRSLGRRRRAVRRLFAASDGEEAVEAELVTDLGDLMRLKPSDRAALYLFVVEQRSHREVADLLEISETAARARVSRALKRLRVELSGEVW